MKESTAVIAKRDDVKHLVYCVALEPDTFDLQDDTVDVETIEKAAHDYLRESRVVGDMHATQAHAEVVESYIAPVDFVMEGQTVAKGSWVMVMKIHDVDLWEAVVKGAYSGISIGGEAVRVPVEKQA